MYFNSDSSRPLSIFYDVYAFSSIFSVPYGKRASYICCNASLSIIELQLIFKTKFKKIYIMNKKSIVEHTSNISVIPVYTCVNNSIRYIIGVQNPPILTTGLTLKKLKSNRLPNIR